MAISKRVSSKNGNNKGSLRKTQYRTITFKEDYSVRHNAQNQALASLTRSHAATPPNPSIRKPPAAQSPFPFKDQKAYLAWAGNRIDMKRVRRDEKARRKARKTALVELEARPSGVERSLHANCVVDDGLLTETLGLGRSKEEDDIYLSKIERRDITELETIYPHPYKWLSECMAATASWKSVWDYTPIKDIRGKTIDRFPIMQLDRSKMTVVPADQSIIFYDPQSPDKPVLFVKRDFVQDEGVRKAIGIMSLKATVERRSDRRDDFGAMASIGYTAGSRKAKEMAMARNHLRADHKADVDRCAQEDLQNGGLLALLWNIMRKSLPRVIIADFDDTIVELDLDRIETGSDKGFEIELDDGKYRFLNGAAAPPTAVTGWNYARYTHADTNANEYMISYTSHTNADPRTGGNFYLAKYGIYVEQASNTCVAWMPEDAHGTTLPNPVPGRHNFGVSLAVSNHLAGAREKAEQREAEAMSGNNDDDGDDADDEAEL